jgi:hypothetical protein
MMNRSLPHLYKGVQFPEKSLWVFGSVLPWSEDPHQSHQTILGRGYLSFVETLLKTAAYYTSDASVLHWTYLFDWQREMKQVGKDQEDRSELFVGFFAPHEEAAKREEKGVAVLPHGLLTEEEIEYVEGRKR